LSQRRWFAKARYEIKKTSKAEVTVIMRTNHAAPENAPLAPLAEHMPEQSLRTHVTKFNTPDYSSQICTVFREIKACLRISPQLCQNYT
jgi:hypothetical protein